MTPKYKLKKNGTSKYAKIDREKPMGPQPNTKNYKQLREAGSTSGPSQGEADQLVVCFQTTLKTYIKVTIDEFNRSQLGIYIYTYICVYGYVNTYMHIFICD